MRVLTVTAVVAERDALGDDGAGWRPSAPPPQRVPLPGGYEVLRRTVASAGEPPAFAPVPASPTPAVWDALAAGVGPAAAAAGTATALTAAALRDEPYDLVISAGIAGGFPAPAAAAGAVRHSGREANAPASGAAPAGAGPDGPAALVVADAIVAADLGAESADGFLPVTELGFGVDLHRPPAALVRAVAAATGAAVGPVLTVSTVTGTAARAAALATRHTGALAEAMEGFGVAEAAAAHGVPVLEIRAVSNPVGPRDRAAWRIPDALRALRAAFAALPPALDAWKNEES